MNHLDENDENYCDIDIQNTHVHRWLCGASTPEFPRLGNLVQTGANQIRSELCPSRQVGRSMQLEGP
jgi:hypothetical protein